MPENPGGCSGRQRCPPGIRRAPAEAAFAVDLQEIGGLLRGVVFGSKFEGDLLRLRFELAARTAQVCFGLRQFGALFAAAIDRNANAKGQHVIGAVLCRDRCAATCIEH